MIHHSHYAIENYLILSVQLNAIEKSIDCFILYGYGRCVNVIKINYYEYDGRSGAFTVTPHIPRIFITNQLVTHILNVAIVDCRPSAPFFAFFHLFSLGFSRLCHFYALRFDCVRVY